MPTLQPRREFSVSRENSRITAKSGRASHSAPRVFQDVLRAKLVVRKMCRYPTYPSANRVTGSTSPETRANAISSGRYPLPYTKMNCNRFKRANVCVTHSFIASIARPRAFSGCIYHCSELMREIEGKASLEQMVPPDRLLARTRSRFGSPREICRFFHKPEKPPWKGRQMHAQTMHGHALTWSVNYETRWQFRNSPCHFLLGCT